jgi:hypothetical protein
MFAEIYKEQDDIIGSFRLKRPEVKKNKRQEFID